MFVFSFLQETGIKLSEDEIQLLLEELDRDGDGEINYKLVFPLYLYFLNYSISKFQYFNYFYSVCMYN